MIRNGRKSMITPWEQHGIKLGILLYIGARIRQVFIFRAAV